MSFLPAQPVFALQRDGKPVSALDDTTIDTRSLHTAQLQQLPFLGYAAVPTTGRPLPAGGSWSEQVDLESSMRPQNREVKGGEPRTITMPLSLWPMHDLQCDTQQCDYRTAPQVTRMSHKCGGAPNTVVFDK